MSDSKQICLTVPKKVYELIVNLSEEEFTTVNSLIRIAIIAYIKERTTGSLPDTRISQ